MPTNRQLSIRDIAEMAGVSIATVSRVINNNGRFSEDTRKRVQKIIDDNGYVTNMAAKTLREARSKTIGMLVPDISNDFFSMLAFYTEQFLYDKGYSVFVCNAVNKTERERAYIRSLVSKSVDGILCISGLGEFSTEVVPKSIPLVCIDRYPSENSEIPRVISENVNGGRIATEHLIERGCKKILIISYEIKDNCRINRERGYREALEAHGFKSNPALYLRLSGRKPSIVETEELLCEYLEAGNIIDGIFASSDHAAVGALNALKKLGIRCPEDVKIIGFDNSIYTRLTTPSITSIDRAPQELADMGCKVLLNLIDGQEAPFETQIPVTLVERESTAI